VTVCVTVPLVARKTTVAVTGPAVGFESTRVVS
jgi:hypothetical protein